MASTVLSLFSFLLSSSIPNAISTFGLPILGFTLNLLFTSAWRVGGLFLMCIKLLLSMYYSNYRTWLISQLIINQWGAIEKDSVRSLQRRFGGIVSSHLFSDLVTTASIFSSRHYYSRYDIKLCSYSYTHSPGFCATFRREQRTTCQKFDFSKYQTIFKSELGPFWGRVKYTKKIQHQWR